MKESDVLPVNGSPSYNFKINEISKAKLIDWPQGGEPAERQLKVAFNDIAIHWPYIRAASIWSPY